MEFWSENHYIMFASSEYLLGQLWQDETFQPCRLFVDAGDTTGARTGAQRRDRGRARVLKWLNNRLMFGWMEFNSSGYYREHLWALLNLVDFALDEEVRTKATMAVDLMLFDVTRYLHRGAMGAAGGRSQFKSKSHGFDNGLTDVVEIMLGVKGVFSEGDAQIAASFASSTYVVPLVLLEIGAAPPAYPFMDRSRVSITFDESAKYGITWSQDSVTKDSLMRGYAAKRARYSPWLAEVNKEIARTHDDYGQVEDDTVFFWGMSAFFNKQVVRNSYSVVKQFGLKKADAFKTHGSAARSRAVLQGAGELRSRLQHPGPARPRPGCAQWRGVRRDRREDRRRPVGGPRGIDAHAGQYRHLPLARVDAVEHPELPLWPAQLPEQHPAGHAQRRSQRLRDGRLRGAGHLRPRDVRSRRSDRRLRRRAGGRDRRRDRSGRRQGRALQDTNPLNPTTTTAPNGGRATGRCPAWCSTAAR